MIDKKWKYLIKTVNNSDLITELNNLGEDGLELVTTEPDGLYRKKIILKIPYYDN